MRAILFTEELMGVALKLSKKSSTMGSLWVSWEPLNSASDKTHLGPPISAPSSTRTSFTRRLQAGLSLCLATLLFTLLVFFAVCSIDSSSFIGLNPPTTSSISSQGSTSSSSGGDTSDVNYSPGSESEMYRPAAQHGMGAVFRRAGRSMSELLVAHVAEDQSEDELRLFLRTVHRSGLAARADVVLLFPGDPRASPLAGVVDEESRRFTALLTASGCGLMNESGGGGGDENLGPGCGGGARLASRCSISRLNLDAFAQAEEERMNRALKNSSGGGIGGNGSEIFRYRAVPLGSITGFDVAELDPLDTLSGFLDRPPIQLRRWLCYQLLLGMAKQQRRRYRQVLLAQVRGVFIFSDSLLAMARRHKDQRALILVSENRSWLDDAAAKPPVAREIHENVDELSEFDDQAVSDLRIRSTGGSRRRSRRRRRLGLIEEVYGKQVWGMIEREDKAGWAVVSSAVLAGGTRAVRGLADAVATEIARAAMMRRHRRPFGDQAVLNYVLRRNANMLGRKVVERMLFVGGASWGDVGGTVAVGGTENGTARHDVVVAGDDARAAVTRLVSEDLCGSPRELAVYSDCQGTESS